jgi:hypothetical protein
MTRVIPHTTRIHPGEPTFLAMSALTIKIPDPIIEPIVIAAESKRLSDFLNWRSTAISLGD